MHAASRTRSPAIPNWPGNTPSIREEYAETISLNESLGAPSARAMQKLFAAIDGRARAQAVGVDQPVRRGSRNFSPAVAADAGLVGEPRRVALLLQAGVIGAVLMKNQTASFQTASLSLNEPIAGADHARSREQRRADARAGAVRAGSPHRRHHGAARQLPGLDRRRRQGRHVPAAVRHKAMSKDEVASLIARLQREKIVSLAVPTP